MNRRTIDEPTDEFGVKASPLTGRAIVDRDATPDTAEPRGEIAALSPGDRIRIDGVETKVSPVGKHVRNGYHYTYRLGIPSEAFGTVATLWVDRDPFLLDICNGPIHPVDPTDVEVAET
jgi:hypothetical protein